jgi:hypothetical protein
LLSRLYFEISISISVLVVAKSKFQGSILVLVQSKGYGVKFRFFKLEPKLPSLTLQTKEIANIRVIHKASLLGGENGQFWHNRGLNV